MRSRRTGRTQPAPPTASQTGSWFSSTHQPTVAICDAFSAISAALSVVVAIAAGDNGRGIHSLSVPTYSELSHVGSSFRAISIVSPS